MTERATEKGREAFKKAKENLILSPMSDTYTQKVPKEILNLSDADLKMVLEDYNVKQKRQDKQDKIDDKYSHLNPTGYKAAKFVGNVLGEEAVETVLTLGMDKVFDPIKYGAKAVDAVADAVKVATKVDDVKDSISFGKKAVEFLKTAPVPTKYTLISGGNVSLDKYEQNVLNGADRNGAFLNALGTGYISSLTEKLGFTGIPGIAKKLNKGVSGSYGKSLGRIFSNYGLNAASEGFEEVLDNIVGGAWDKATLYPEITWGEIFDPKTNFESFAGGAMIGTILGGLGTAYSVANLKTDSNNIKQKIDTLIEVNKTLPEELRLKNLDKDSDIEAVNEYTTKVIEKFEEAKVNVKDYYTDMGLLKKLGNNVELIKKAGIVAKLDETMFEKGKEDLVTQVDRYFESLNNSVHREGFGDIQLNKKGIKSSIGHKMGRVKAIAFHAVPDVIQKGVQIDVSENWKDRNYDTYVFAAPVELNEKEMYMGVVVKKDKNTSEYYLHEVIDEDGNIAVLNKKRVEPFKTESFVSETSLGGSTPINNSVPQPDNTVNNNSMQDFENNSETSKIISSLSRIMGGAEVSESDIESLIQNPVIYEVYTGNKIKENAETEIRQYLEEMNKKNARANSIISAISDKTGLAFDYDITLPEKTAGYYDPENKKIVLNPAHKDPLSYAVVHELTHFVENKKGYGAYVKNIMESVVYKDMIATKYKGNEDLYYKEIYDTYYDVYKEYDDKTFNSLLEREMVAKFNEYLINEKPEALARLSRNDKGIQAVYRNIREFFEEIKLFLKGESEKAYAMKMARKFRQLATDKDVANSNETIRYSIEKNSKGYYVKADRKVVFGNTKKEMAKNIEKYINTLLDQNGHLEIKAMDGSEILITETTAWKIADVKKSVNNKKIEMTDEEFAVKAHAGAHIDELLKVSQDTYDYEVDKKDHYYADYWGYRTVFFEDYDGQYYKLSLSIGITPEEGNKAYNIGYIKNRTNKVIGSSVHSPDGAQNVSSANNRITHPKPIVNTNSMQNSEKNSGSEQFSITPTAEKNSTTTENKSKDERYQELIKKYRTIPQGENADSVYKEDEKSYNEYTKEEYENYGWARANNILNAGQNSDYRSKFAMAKSGQARFPKSKNGEFIIPVSDINDSIFRGINNVLVFAKGEIDNPIITKVIEIFEYDETNLDKVRRNVYELERRGIQQKTGNIIRRYDATDIGVRQYAEYIKSRRHNNDNGNGRGNSEQTTSTEETKQYAITPTAEKNNTSTENKSKDERYQELIKKYRTIPQGENPYRDIEVPKRSSDRKYVSRHARTILEAEVMPDEMISEFEELIISEKMSHEVISDKKAERKAIDNMKEEGYWAVYDKWKANLGKSYDKNFIVQGQALFNQAATAKDVETAMELAADLAMLATETGQNLQAMRMLKKMTPDGQLYCLERVVSSINKKIETESSYKDKVEVKIDKELAKKLLEAKTTEEIEIAVENIQKDIAEQVPSTAWDKINAWRYLAMLGNPRTHIRNILGNAFFKPVVGTKDMIGSALEKVLVSPDERTKSVIVSKENKAFALDDYLNICKDIKGQGKYDVTQGIIKNKTVFKTKFLERLRELNFNLMEAEDDFFFKSAYVSAFSQAMQARKLSPTQLSQDTPFAKKQLEELRNYATEQAQTATFRNASRLCIAINVMQNVASESKARNALKLGIDAVFPFKQTPVNIITSGLEYSPIGLVKGIYDVSYKLKKGKITATDAVESFAKGLTGASITLLGYFLSSVGWLSGPGDEEKKKNYFDDMTGKLDYSLKIGNMYYTIDWVAPFSLPLFVGNEIYKLTEEKGLTVSDGLNAITKLADPIINLSMLSGINSTIKSAAYSQNNAIAGITGTILSNYASQFIPTAFSQIARVVDPQVRTTYQEKGKFEWLDTTTQTLMKKIPGASYLLNPKIDNFGRPVREKNNIALRAFEKILSPGQISFENIGEVEKVLNEIYLETGDLAVYPSSAGKSVTIDGVKKNLTAKQYTAYAKEKGQVAYKILNDIIKHYLFKNLTTEEKVSVFEKAYKYANDVAKYEVLDVELKGKNKSIYKSSNQAALLIKSIK